MKKEGYGPTSKQRGRGLSTTKPGTLRKQSIPVRTFPDRDEAQMGFVEMDASAFAQDRFWWPTVVSRRRGST